MKRIRFGKYDLIEKIASGGMAEIFLAKQSGVRGFSKIVVIKRIHKHLSGDAEFIAMFINEARVAAQLNHQNIVQIYDFGSHQNSHYIAMEYIHGKDLKTVYNRCRMTSTQLPLELSIHIIQQICNGLDYAHRKRDLNHRSLNIVHRDVSPQNVLISYEGETKITDFGIAKAATQLRATQAGTLKGKIAYMSPEQAWGKEIDRRSDIFAIGIIFYEILLNRRLFLGSSDLETLENVRNCGKITLRDKDPSIPSEIERIIQRALERDVDKRYQSAREMYQDLERFAVQNGFLHQPYRLAEYMRQLFLDKQPGQPVLPPSPMQFKAKIAPSVADALPDDAEQVENEQYRGESNAESQEDKGQKPAADAVSPAPGSPRRRSRAQRKIKRTRSDLPVQEAPVDKQRVVPAKPGVVFAQEDAVEDVETSTEGEGSVTGARHPKAQRLTAQSSFFDVIRKSFKNEKIMMSFIFSAAAIILILSFIIIPKLISSNKGAAEASGTLKLICNVTGARIYFDRKAVGALDKNEGILQKLPIGKHELFVKADGYQDFVRTLEFAPNEEKTIEIILKPYTGIFSVAANQDNLEVTLHKKDAKLTEMSTYSVQIYRKSLRSSPRYYIIDEIPVGQYELKVKKEGRVLLTDSVVILKEQVSKYFAEVQQIVPHYKLSVTSNVSEAVILVDGKAQGFTRDLMANSMTLKAGEHTIKITKQGYKTFFKKIELYSDLPLYAKLEPATGGSVDSEEEHIGGDIVITANITGIIIFIDGHRIIKTRKKISTIRGIPDGKHELVATRSGYRMVTKYIVVKKGEDTEVTIEMLKNVNH